MLWEGKSALVGGHRARKPILLRTRPRGAGVCVYVCVRGATGSLPDSQLSSKGHAKLITENPSLKWHEDWNFLESSLRQKFHD